MNKIKRRATETIVSYWQRSYPKLRGGMCEICQIVEPDIHRRHLALAECEGATLRNSEPVRCGKPACRHHLHFKANLPICAKCMGEAPSPEVVASYSVKPTIAKQVDLFAPVAA